MKDETFRPNRVLSYFQEEWKILFLVTVSGLIYNLGLLAGPWFEGKMTGKLVDLLGGTGTFHQMLMLVTAYVVSIGIVQVSRYFKRFYVRSRFFTERWFAKAAWSWKRKVPEMY